MVWDVHQALPDVPLVGIGGIETGRDVVEFLLAGASAVQVGTAVFRDPAAPLRIVDELAAVLRRARHRRRRRADRRRCNGHDARDEAVRRLVVAARHAEPRAGAGAGRGRCAAGSACSRSASRRSRACGPALVEELRGAGVPVFLDLKLHDIPNTVERAAANVRAPRRAAPHRARRRRPGDAGGRRAGAAAGATGRAAARVLAVTVLTSLDDAALDALGMPRRRRRAWRRGPSSPTTRGAAASSARRTRSPRCAGASAPPSCCSHPGSGPAGAALGDQTRVATPAAAIAAGADYLVVGRPITAAPDPVAAAEAIVAEMTGSPAVTGRSELVKKSLHKLSAHRSSA